MVDDFISPPFSLDTDDLGFDRPLYDRILPMTDDMLRPDPMHIKYVSYVYDRFCILRTNFPGPIESLISKFAYIFKKENALSSKISTV